MISRLGNSRRNSGFTLTELLVVILIIVLLASVGVPMLAQQVKSSRVKSAANVVIAALYKARSEAQRYRNPVGVFYGDDTARLNPMPSNGVLPRNGVIELWTVQVDNAAVNTTQANHTRFTTYLTDDSSTWKEDFFSASGCLPFNPVDDTTPFDSKDRLLSPEPITFSDGVRIISGSFAFNGAQRVFSFPSYSRTPRGEIKRHTTTFARNGAAASPREAYSYRSLLVFDTATGEHLVIEAAEWKGMTRPRILTDASGNVNLTHLGGPGGTIKPISDYRQIQSLIDQ